MVIHEICVAAECVRGLLRELTPPGLHGAASFSGLLVGSNPHPRAIQRSPAPMFGELSVNTFPSLSGEWVGVLLEDFTKEELHHDV